MAKRARRRDGRKRVDDSLADWEKELLLDKSRQQITEFNKALLLNVEKSRSKKK
jgi:hypothetical protein